MQTFRSKEKIWQRAWQGKSCCLQSPSARDCNTQQTSELQVLLVPPLQELCSHCWGGKHLQLSCPGELQHLPGDAARARCFPTNRNLLKGAGREPGGRANHSPSLMQIKAFLGHLPDSGSFSASLEAGGGWGLLFTYPTWVLFFKHDARWPTIFIQVNSSFSRIELTIQQFQEQTSTQRQKT